VWEKSCRLQLGKALRNSRGTPLNEDADDDGGPLFAISGGVLGVDYRRVPGNPDPPALKVRRPRMHVRALWLSILVPYSRMPYSSYTSSTHRMQRS
jgi:hypothetical protein